MTKKILRAATEQIEFALARLRVTTTAEMVSKDWVLSLI
jgi:hypothetical protein